MSQIVEPTVSRPASQIPIGQTAPRLLRQGSKLLNLVAIAKAQKGLLWLVLGLIMMYVVQFTVISAGSPALTLAFAALYFVVMLVSMFMVGRLARAIGYNWFVVVVACLLLVVPLINLLIILSVNGRASMLLKLTGVKVGLMGVSERDMPRLYAGACSDCGYSLRDLVGDKCPECGAPVRAA